MEQGSSEKWLIPGLGQEVFQAQLSYQIKSKLSSNTMVLLKGLRQLEETSIVPIRDNLSINS